MRDCYSVRRRLKKLGLRNLFRGRGEINCLHQVLLPGELIEYAITGKYDAGYGMLVATNKRLLLVDKMLGNLFVDDIPYDVISEVDYGFAPFSCSLTVIAKSRTVCFKSVKQVRVRRMANILETKLQQATEQERRFTFRHFHPFGKYEKA